MINIAKLEKGRIHSQIGSIPDPFLNLNVISTTFWSGTHSLEEVVMILNEKEFIRLNKGAYSEIFCDRTHKYVYKIWL